MFMFFIVVLIVLLFQNFIYLCIVMLCMYVLLEYLSMVIVSFIFVYVVCGRMAFAEHRS